MPISVSVPTLSQEEVDYVTQAVLSKRIANGGDVQALDRIESPTCDMLMAKSKELGPPVNGGFRFFVKGNRGQELQWWDGADILVFESRHTLTDMQFNSARCHLGYELLYAFLEAQGIRVTYGKGIRSGNGVADIMERAVNVITDHLDTVMYNYKQKLRQALFLSGAAGTKNLIGVDGLFPITGNTTGSIGGRSRTNERFRHYLKTGVTKDTVMLEFFRMIRSQTRRAGGKKPSIISAGDLFYDMLVDLFSGTSTVAGKFDYRSARESALAKGEKYNIALPQNAFMYENTLIVNEPLFEELDTIDTGAAIPWSKRCYSFITENFGVVPVMDQALVKHDMPYNQRLERASMHGEYVEWCNLPNAQAVMTAA